MAASGAVRGLDGAAGPSFLASKPPADSAALDAHPDRRRTGEETPVKSWAATWPEAALEYRAPSVTGQGAWWSHRRGTPCFS